MKHDEIVEEIAKLNEATVYLKRQIERPKSKLDNFKEYAGVASLILSLAAGVFAIYSSFWLDPQKSKMDAQEKLHETLAQIVTLDQEYIKEVQQGDPNADNGTLESKRNILLQQAEDLAGQRGVATAEDENNLGALYQFGRRPEPALAHFNTAWRLADKDPLNRALADTEIGTLSFYGISNSTKEEGRKHFEDAEQVLGKPTTLQTGLALVRSLGRRSLMECSIGDPTLGEQAYKKAQDELAVLASNPIVTPMSLNNYKASLIMGLSNTHCTVM